MASLSKTNDLAVKIAEERKDIDNVNILISQVESRLEELEENKNIQIARISELEAKRSGLISKKSEDSDEYTKLEEQLENLRQKRLEVEHGNDDFDRELNQIRIRIKVRMVSWVPGSPIACAAMMPTASPMSTGLPVARFAP